MPKANDHPIKVGLLENSVINVIYAKIDIWSGPAIRRSKFSQSLEKSTQKKPGLKNEIGF